MKKLTKILALILAVMLCSLTFVACNNKDGNEDESGSSGTSGVSTSCTSCASICASNFRCSSFVNASTFLLSSGTRLSRTQGFSSTNSISKAYSNAIFSTVSMRFVLVAESDSPFLTFPSFFFCVTDII